MRDIFGNEVCLFIFIITPFQGLIIIVISYRWASPIADLLRRFAAIYVIFLCGALPIADVSCGLAAIYV